MGIFDFLRPQPNFEKEFRQLEGLRITTRQNLKVIEFSHEVTLEKVKKLLRLLRKCKIKFAVYDKLYYPLGTDPGAYISYSQESNDWENAWSMTLGNHGWSGGIFTIEEHNIALQLYNLVSKKLIDSIRIEKVGLFLHYDKKNNEDNSNENARLYGIHSDISKIEAQYLIFSLFSREDADKYNIYQLTPDKLFVDTSRTWLSARLSHQGYVFKGIELSKDKFELARVLLNEIPVRLLKENWFGFYETGDEQDEVLLLDYETPDFHRIISGYCHVVTEKLPLEIANYRKAIEGIIRRLEEKLSH